MRAKVSHEDFVVAWMTSATIDDVIKDTGMTRAAVYQRAKSLRDKGVQLKKLDRPRLDALRIAQLNSLVRKYEKRRS